MRRSSALGLLSAPLSVIGFACALSWASALGVGALGASAQPDPLARAQTMLDAGDVQAAIGILDQALAGRKKSAQAFLLRSTAHFMAGDRELGSVDLNEALRLDPKLRQGWLNRGALALSDRRYEEALRDFEQARSLDPAADDNDLNLGVGLMFTGRIDEASQHFESYVARQAEPAAALLLVSKNFALGGYQERALEVLERAVALDERQRLIAKTDPAYEQLLGNVRFQRLLHRDSFALAPGSSLATLSFDASYEGGRGPLLGAVIDALGKLGLPLDPRVEVTPDWALLWTDVRIKVGPGEPGQGRVEVSAPPGLFSDRDWRARVERLSDQIRYQLAPKIPNP